MAKGRHDLRSTDKVQWSECSDAGKSNEDAFPRLSWANLRDTKIMGKARDRAPGTVCHLTSEKGTRRYRIQGHTCICLELFVHVYFLKARTNQKLIKMAIHRGERERGGRQE